MTIDFIPTLEPESPNNEDTQPESRHNYVTSTPRGHFFEMDDTPDRERVRLSHRSGTFIEMHPGGDEVHKVYGDGYEITVKNKQVIIQGDCKVEIHGDCSVHELEGVQPADTLSLQVGSQWTIYGSPYQVTKVRKLANGGLDIHFESVNESLVAR